MQKIIIVGASSGIGWDLAKIYSKNGFEVGITARRYDYLENLQKELPNKSYIKKMDVANPQEARQLLADLVDEMGGMDILVLNAGIGDSKPSWELEMQIVNVNIAGFTALANWAVAYYETKGGGQIAGVSSVASIRGTHIATVYSASKAYISSYMEGLQQRSNKKRQHITITDIRPGFVATPMTQENKGMFWVASPEKAAKQIYEAIKAKKRVAYITKRWWIVAQLIKCIPDFLWLKG
ncbi:SDR family NAD(P)-dependent oxidoreductase [soil metagenome]